MGTENWLTGRAGTAYLVGPPRGIGTAGDQPQLIQGIRSGDGVGEDQETTA